MAVKDIFAEGGKMPGLVADQNGPQKEQTMDELMEELNKGDITEAKRSILRLRIAEMNARVKELESRGQQPAPVPPATQTAPPETLEQKAERRQREILDGALKLMQNGASPAIVNQFLASASQTAAPGVGVPGQSMDLGGIAGLITAVAGIMKGNQGEQGGASAANAQITALIQEMKADRDARRDEQMKAMLDTQKLMVEEVRAIKTGETRRQPEQVKVRTRIYLPDNAGKWIPQEFSSDDTIILPPAPIADKGGKTIEEIREENRHAEKLAELGIENTRKDENRKMLSESVATVISAVSSLATSKVAGGSPASPVASSPDLGSMNCETCKKDFNFTLGATHITCPHCGSKYTDSSMLPPEPPPVARPPTMPPPPPPVDVQPVADPPIVAGKEGKE